MNSLKIGQLKQLGNCLKTDKEQSFDSLIFIYSFFSLGLWEG